MKKLLAMVLALVMTLSLAVSANAAFKDDKSISDDYAESVAVLNGMGVFKGYPDGTFKPSGNVTGYEVLAMILRAVGYDKNNEFSGADWALHVTQTAQQAGVLKNVKGVDLNAAASRELVAELLFQGIQKAQVTYTSAFGYVTDKVISTKTNSLGEKNFKLASAVAADKWGRPATKWTYNVGDKSTLVVAKADASYTTKVDECDIAKDLGITSSKKIEKAYIDGVSQTVTNSTVTTDRNGHVTDATVDLKVYQVNDTGIDKAGVEAEGFTVGQYVLVTMTVDTASPVVQTVEAATVTPMGQLKNWSYAYGTTAATTTLADTKYNDADKFYVGNVKGTAYTAAAWDSIVDSYGNLIGMVASSVNYVVVEKISWKHDNSTVAGGKALADLVLADGTKVAGATIASVDNAVTTNYNSGVVEVLTAEVADDYTNNNAYYNRIFTYSVNADGSYDLVKYCDATNVNSHNTGAVTITKGKTATIAGFTNTVVANTDTMFLVIDDTTVSLADNLISPLPPALNTTNSAATLVMSTCERTNSIAALAVVVTSGPASLTRQLASRAAATSCCTAVTAEVSALVFSVSSWLLSAVSSLCVRSFGHLDEVRFFPVGKSVVGCTFQCKILRYDRNKKALPKQCFRVS